MRINADFGQRASAHAADTPWVASPMPGVDRRMLDRIGDEVARATSIVRYAPGSAFSPHVHDGGGDFLVLDSEFEDEHGAKPAGSYVGKPHSTPVDRSVQLPFALRTAASLAKRVDEARTSNGAVEPKSFIQIIGS